MITNLLLGIFLYREALDNPPPTLTGVIGGIVLIIIICWLVFTSDKNDN